jgi:hypothetical protein
VDGDEYRASSTPKTIADQPVLRATRQHPASNVDTAPTTSRPNSIVSVKFISGSASVQATHAQHHVGERRKERQYVRP